MKGGATWSKRGFELKPDDHPFAYERTRIEMNEERIR